VYELIKIDKKKTLITSNAFFFSFQKTWTLE
jgi:hypothetical protein